MKRTFISVNQDDIDAKLAENLQSRELELLSYDFERATHEAAIAQLGNIKWNTETGQYKNLARDVMVARAIANGLNSAQIQEIADLNSLESHRLNLEAVKVETAKSERHYKSILAALPKGARRNVALANLTAKLAAREKATQRRMA